MPNALLYWFLIMILILAGVDKARRKRGETKDELERERQRETVL